MARSGCCRGFRSFNDHFATCDEGCTGLVAAAKYQFTLTTITTGGCIPAVCVSNLNTTFTLTSVATCNWQSGSFKHCGPVGVEESVVWQLRIFEFSGSFTFQLAMDNGATDRVLYNKTFSASQDCLSSFTLDKSDVSGTFCGGWPDTITVDPV